MKRILMLLILMSLSKITFSLEITYMRTIDGSSNQVVFSDDGETIFNISGTVIDVQDGTKTDFAYGKEIRSDSGIEFIIPLGRFGAISRHDKFGRKQRTLVSFEHGEKLISEETRQNIRTGGIIEYSKNGRSWSVALYGNSGVRTGEFKLSWDGAYFGIEFFSDSTKTVDLPIEMVYGVNPESMCAVKMSYDLLDLLGV